MQFTNGAKTLINLARSHMDLMKPLFVGGEQVLTFANFRQLYTVDYAEAGSNNRLQEDETVFAWECCLQKCEGVCCIHLGK